MCEGAQEACAYKVRAAVVAAIDAAYLAANDVAISPSVGLLGNTIEDTFRNLATLNNRGLAEAEQLILELI